MEVMPHHANTHWGPAVETRPDSGLVPSTTWRDGLPVVHGLGFTLRELVAADAQTLMQHLTPAEVSRFISPPPASVTGFERFIAWAQRERAAGRYACFAVVPDGEQTAVGIFLAGAQRVVDFAFTEMGLHRLEARASVANGRGNGALAKLGAVREAVLRRSFERHGVWHDQALWSLWRDDWHQRLSTPSGPGTPVH